MLEKLLDFERGAFLFLNGIHTSYLDQFVWLYTGKIAWIPIALFILFVICYKKNWKESALILLSIVLVITLCDQFASSICKPLFARLRPTQHPEFMEEVHTVFGYRGGKYGFISSHAANAFGFAVYTSLLFKYRLYTFFILIWSSFMAYTRIYLGVHFISDVIPSVIVGVGFSYVCYKLYVFVRNRALKPVDAPEQLYTTHQKQLIVYGILITISLLLIISLIKL